MPLSHNWFFDRLKKRASRPARGYPIAEGADVAPLERWYSPEKDARKNPQLLKTVLQFLEAQGVKSVVMPDRLLGCPHEEGIDYPEGEPCPQCPYWRNRDRFTGLLHGEEDDL